MIPFTHYLLRKISFNNMRYFIRLLTPFHDKMLTGKEIRTGVVKTFQSFGDFLRFNPHFHCFILEGGFDENGNFIHIPITDLESMKECFRKLVIKYFEDSKLLSSELSKNLPHVFLKHFT